MLEQKKIPSIFSSNDFAFTPNNLSVSDEQWVMSFANVKKCNIRMTYPPSTYCQANGLILLEGIENNNRIFFRISLEDISYTTSTSKTRIAIRKVTIKPSKLAKSGFTYSVATKNKAEKNFKETPEQPLESSKNNSSVDYLIKKAVFKHLLEEIKVSCHADYISKKEADLLMQLVLTEQQNTPKYFYGRNNNNSKNFFSSNSNSASESESRESSETSRSWALKILGKYGFKLPKEMKNFIEEDDADADTKQKENCFIS